jgi:hypothetical protein
VIQTYKGVTKRRYAKAYCNLVNWKWDRLFGEKPDGFDDLPCTSSDVGVKTKKSIINPILLVATKYSNDFWRSYYWNKTFFGVSIFSFLIWWLKSKDKDDFDTKAPKC